MKIPESAEPDIFWDYLSGKTEYPSDGPVYTNSREPRLFQCSNASGAFTIEEIFNFSQDDLDPNDVFLLGREKFN